MTKLTDTLKQMLNALAHADAGEFLTPGQKTEHLNRALGLATPAPAVAAPVVDEANPAPSASRRVALYVGSELPAEMMDYVVQTCARLKHGLTVLTFQPESTSRALFKPYQETLAAEGIDLQLVTLTGEQPIPALTRFLRSHPEVAFLACKDTGYLGRSFLKGTQRKNALPVPVVLIETQQDGVRKPVPAQIDHQANQASSA